MRLKLPPTQNLRLLHLGLAMLNELILLILLISLISLILLTALAMLAELISLADALKR